MVMTILEAHVYPRQWATLQEAYKAGIKQLDPGIVGTYLIQKANDAEVWQILTVWSDQEALDAMRNSGEMPRGVQMFRSVGAQPALVVQNVVAGTTC
jgi:quinol monooxygenase YgiN